MSAAITAPTGEQVQVMQGNNLQILKQFPDEYFSAVVTDPPYGLSNYPEEKIRQLISAWKEGEDYRTGAGFKGADWDQLPGPKFWAECMRVLRPGGHVAAFAATRNHDLATLAIRLADFEIRDQLAWIYGGGFPKSRDMTAAMEAWQSGNGVHDGVHRITRFLARERDRAGWSNRRIDELLGTNGMAGHWTTQASQPAVPSLRQWQILKEALGFDDAEVAGALALHAATERPESSPRPRTGILPGLGGTNGAGQEWGTALRPAIEPIILARRPLPGGTGRSNVAHYGTGALYLESSANGWPANVAISEEIAAELGDRSRFFYCAKASKKERPKSGGVAHLTVKPIALMRWLVRLIAPPGGLILDPFAGSGTTGEACLLEGFQAVLIEQEPAFIPLIHQRLDRQVRPLSYLSKKGADLGLFADWAVAK